MGSYLLNSGDLQVLATEYVGYRGAGVFNQTGGTNTTDGGLGLASLVGSTGQYHLSGAGVLQVGGSESIGTAGMGIFTQTGDTTHSVRNQLHVGGNAGSTGIYAQNGGTTTVKNELRLANNPGSTGQYELNGGSLLVGGGSGREVIGVSGVGTFIQTDGTHAVTNELTVGGGPDGTGLYELSGTGILSANDETIGWQGSGTFTQTGGTNTIANWLYVGRESGGTGTYDLNGTGLLSAGNEYIGNSGTGTFTQSGGTNTVANRLDLGRESGATGTYNLSGAGVLNAGDEAIGYLGTGTFTQTGGTNAITNWLYVGFRSGGTGTYDLSGPGALSANHEIMGYYGTGAFAQTAGTNTMNWLYLGYSTDSTGTYDLSETGILSTTCEIVGRSGTGTFTQTGGTNTIAGDLVVGDKSGSTGRYNLSGTGVLISDDDEFVGRDGTGIFTQTGGTNTTKDLYIGSQSGGTGTYNLDGGTLTAASIVNNDQFNYSGGSLSGNVTNNAGATFALSGAGTRTVNGDVTNDGTVKVAGATDGTTVQFTGTFTNNGTLDSDPARLEFYGDFVVGPDGSIHASAGDQYVFYQDFLINSTSTTGWTTSEADLIFIGDGTHQLSFGDLDLMWNSLLLEEGVLLDFIGTGSFTASLLDGLIIDPDGSIANLSASAGFTLLYDPARNPDLIGTYVLPGGGSLAPSVIPVPAAVLLELVGLMGLTAVRRRLK
jgi:hypothetical protein